MTVGILPYKLDRLISLLRDWALAKSYNLLEISRLLGVLENHTKYARWTRCWYFAIQNHARRALFTRYQILSRGYNKGKREAKFTRQLPESLFHRLGSLISRDQARMLWTTRQRFAVDGAFLGSIHHLLAYAESSSTPWEVPLGMIIQRDPHFWS